MAVMETATGAMVVMVVMETATGAMVVMVAAIIAGIPGTTTPINETIASMHESIANLSARMKTHMKTEYMALTITLIRMMPWIQHTNGTTITAAIEVDKHAIRMSCFSEI
jgi:hypothetical protein